MLEVWKQGDLLIAERSKPSGPGSLKMVFLTISTIDDQSKRKSSIAFDSSRHLSRGSISCSCLEVGRILSG